MRVLLSILKWLLIVIILLVVLAFATGNQYLLKGIWATYLHGYKTASVDDKRFFSTRTIAAGEPQPWPIAPDHNQMQLSEELRQSLESTRSVAFLIARNGELLYEEYWDGYGETSRTNSFSMAKSITTMLAQCAIQDGFMQSWDQRVIEFLPDLKGEYADQLTLRHLTTMTAGLEFNEHYTNPFDITARLYYGTDSEELMLEEVPVYREPGTFEYQSGATQLLGLAVTKATRRTLSDYASDKLWRHMGAAHDAEWHLDSREGNEHAYCCFNSNARDFARFGQLMLQKGNWNGQQLLDTAFVEVAVQPYAVPHYGYSFWLLTDAGTEVYYMRGIHGQYIITIPELDLVVVRLGHEMGPKRENHPEVVWRIVREMVGTFEAEPAYMQ
jgi:CubicO group peptidase (beta-lactamase class C family)